MMNLNFHGSKYLEILKVYSCIVIQSDKAFTIPIQIVVKIRLFLSLLIFTSQVSKNAKYKCEGVSFKYP